VIFVEEGSSNRNKAYRRRNKRERERERRIGRAFASAENDYHVDGRFYPRLSLPRITSCTRSNAISFSCVRTAKLIFFGANLVLYIIVCHVCVHANL
jgi:hypothetical protein